MSSRHPDFDAVWQDFQRIYKDPTRAEKWYNLWLEFNGLNDNEPWPEGFEPKGNKSQNSSKEQGLAIYTFHLNPLHTKEDFCNQYDGVQAGKPFDLPAIPPLHVNCACYVTEEPIENTPRNARLLELGVDPRTIGEPFAGYLNFDDCVTKNQDKDDPEGYCAVTKRKSEPERRLKFENERQLSKALNERQPTENSREMVSRLEQLGLVPFKMVSKLAIPTVSGNNRRWEESELKNAATLYPGRPVMLDHSMDTGDVAAITTRSFYGPSEVRPEDKQDALRAESVGYMDAVLFEKLRTDKREAGVPPLVKGLSIGGAADVELDLEKGHEIPRNFIPEEYSITPFPGIKEAEIEKLTPIYESLRKKRESSPNSSSPIVLQPKDGKKVPEGYREIGADKERIWVLQSWYAKVASELAGKFVNTGKPPLDWWERCIDGVTQSGAANDPEAVCGNVWFNVLGEMGKINIPRAQQEIILKELRNTPSKQERAEIQKGLENIQRGVKIIEAQAAKEAEHGMVPPDADGKCPDGYSLGDDKMCHLTAPESKKQESAALKTRLDQLEAENKELREKVKRLESGKRIPADYGKGISNLEGETALKLSGNPTAVTGRYNELLKQGFSRKDAWETVAFEILGETRS